MNRARACRLAFLVGLLVLAVGCGKKKADLPPPPVPRVVVEHPVIKPVTDFEFFTGRTEPSEYIEIRSRVTGYLKKAPLARSEARNGDVREGDDVKQGTVLFVIDPSMFEAETERAEANIRQYQAMMEKLDTDYRRARTLLPSRAISREEVDKIVGDRSQMDANVRVARSQAKMAKINLGYTKIEAPISGRLSRRWVDPGNLVKADDTILTNIVRLDPMHANFDIDERTVLRLRRLFHEGKISSARTNKLFVKLALADEEEFTREGYIDFVDNRLDSGTGTLRIRVEIRNKDVFLSPGMFVRLRLPIGNERPALLVPEQALARDLKERFVLVVSDRKKMDNEQETYELDRIDVKVGQPQANNMRVVEEILDDNGKWVPLKISADAKKAKLKPSDRIVTEGLQSVRAKTYAVVDERPNKDVKAAKAPPKQEKSELQTK